VKLLQRRRASRAGTIRRAEPYLVAAAGEARRLGHAYIGTEHVLQALVRDPDGALAGLLARLGVPAAATDAALAPWLEPRSTAAIDGQALATLGIDLEAVREHLDRAFGAGALERTRSGCLPVTPRLKMALVAALDHAAGGTLGDEQMLLGMLDVPDSVGARVLRGLGVTDERLRAIADPR